MKKPITKNVTQNPIYHVTPVMCSWKTGTYFYYLGTPRPKTVSDTWPAPS